MFESHNSRDKCVSTPWLCDTTPQLAQWKSQSESAMCTDSEPDPGESVAK